MLQIQANVVWSLPLTLGFLPPPVAQHLQGHERSHWRCFETGIPLCFADRAPRPVVLPIGREPVEGVPLAAPPTEQGKHVEHRGGHGAVGLLLMCSQ